MKKFIRCTTLLGMLGFSTFALSNVELTFPANGEQLVSGEDITLTAEVIDIADVVSVSFYAGDFLIGTDATAPYSIDVDGAGVIPGDFLLTAVAVDAAGVETTSPINSVTVEASPTANIPTVVTLTSPIDGATYDQGAAIEMTADATDEDGTVAKVEFYAADVLLGTATEAPYAIDVDPTLLVPGTYELSARATDDDDAITFSVANAITINAADNAAPTVELTFPADAEVLTAGENITLTADAIDSDGTVASVSFYAGDFFIGTDTTAPYSIDVDGAGVVAGAYELTAVAVDNLGAETTSVINNVNVTAEPGANIPPTVTLTTPEDGASYVEGDMITMIADAADVDGTVANVEFYAADVLLGAATEAPYSIEVDPALLVVGEYEITARATDDNDETTFSTVSTITITDEPVGNVAPVVGLTSPVDGAVYTVGDAIAINATATDSDGTVTSVAFYAGDVLLVTDTEAPYSYTWADAVVGNYVVTAVATDDQEAVTTSESVNVTVESDVVTPGAPPVNAIACASENTFCVLPTGITATVWYGAEGGWTSQTGLQGNVACNNAAFGDPLSGVVKSCFYLAEGTPVPNVPPVVGISAPADNTVYTVGDAIVISATASDEDGTVASVAFYAGDTLLGTAAEMPYAVTWADAAAGTYAITAIATDDDGDATTSAAVTVAVEAAPVPNVPPVVGISAPADNTVYTVGDAIAISATASDDDGTVASVAFYAGDTLLGTATETPYSLTWSDAAAGSYAITAIATDDDGDATTSAAVNVTVEQPFTGVLFSDNFESANGWTRNPYGTDTATKGLFERANPQQTVHWFTTVQLGSTTSGYNALVTEGSAGYSVGSNDVDHGVTSIRSPAIELPASGDIELSFNYYLAHLSNASSADYLRVRVIGDTTATVLDVRGKSSNVGGAWKSATVSLDDFAGQTIYLLVEAADGGSASLVEAAVDDVEIEVK